MDGGIRTIACDNSKYRGYQAPLLVLSMEQQVNRRTACTRIEVPTQVAGEINLQPLQVRMRFIIVNNTSEFPSRRNEREVNRRLTGSRQLPRPGSSTRHHGHQGRQGGKGISRDYEQLLQAVGFPWCFVLYIVLTCSDTGPGSRLLPRHGSHPIWKPINGQARRKKAESDFHLFLHPNSPRDDSLKPIHPLSSKVRWSTMSVISPGSEAVEGSNEAAVGEGIQGTLHLPPLPISAKSLPY